MFQSWSIKDEIETSIRTFQSVRDEIQNTFSKIEWRDDENGRENYIKVNHTVESKLQTKHKNKGKSFKLKFILNSMGRVHYALRANVHHYRFQMIFPNFRNANIKPTVPGCNVIMEGKKKTDFNCRSILFLS